MSFRIVVISNSGKLDTSMGHLVYRGETTNRVYLDEIETLIIESTAVSITSALLVELLARKIKVIFCDQKRNPAAELVPYYGSFDCANKLRNQISWSATVKNTVWAEIVREKIRKQAQELQARGFEDKRDMLMAYACDVQSADVTNREGHAAKVYFNTLFGKEFSRSDDCMINAKLDYGYTLIMSLCNREIACCGYLTQLGIGHDNMFNFFNLGCDVMEPFRVLVDDFVIKHPEYSMDTEGKHAMQSILTSSVRINGTNQTLINAVRIYVRSVFDALDQGDIAKIKFPYYEL